MVRYIYEILFLVYVLIIFHVFRIMLVVSIFFFKSETVL